MSCTSGSMDDVMFDTMARNRQHVKAYTQSDSKGGSTGPGAESDCHVTENTTE